MNNEPEFDPTLEEELRQVKPAHIDETLLERISHAATDRPSAPQVSTRRPHRWLWLIPFTATAAIVLALTLSPQKTDNQPDKIAAKSLNKPTKEEPIELFPIRRNNQVVEAINEGIIHIEGRQPYRSVPSSPVLPFHLPTSHPPFGAFHLFAHLQLPHMPPSALLP